MSSRILATVLALVLVRAFGVKAEPEDLRVTAPPPEWHFAPSYTKHVSAHGLPVVGSDKVSDYALKEAAYLIDRMLADRPDVRAAMIENKVRFAVMAASERTTDVPEHSDLKPAAYWNRRARGLGATRVRPAVSCGEENLLGFPGDPYSTENILVHEFGHAIHEMGLNRVDPEFDGRLKAAYKAAMDKDLWKGKYAATNHHEYWAEGVQSYFDTNRQNDHDHNHVNTREELAEYDPDLFRLVDEAFRKSPWRYQRPRERAGRGHLAGYDPSRAPRFAWEPELEREFRKIQEERKGRNKL